MRLLTALLWCGVATVGLLSVASLLLLASGWLVWRRLARELGWRLPDRLLFRL